LPTGWVSTSRGRAVVKLATAAYEERELRSGRLDAARLAILAEMLEEAGAVDAGLLGHLRSPGPHARGSAAVDALLGRMSPAACQSTRPEGKRTDPGPPRPVAQQQSGARPLSCRL
jgi:hypothetical protein